MHITDLFTLEELDAEIEAKRIRPNDHPTLPLRLFNYTEIAQYQKAWNDVTRTCRGLIVHRETGEILARPFPKFFNHAEEQHPSFSVDEPITVTDKMDGSLGITYPTAGGTLAIATRGSFTSEQAIHATAILRTGYPDWRQRLARRSRPNGPHTSPTGPCRPCTSWTSTAPWRSRATETSTTAPKYTSTP